LWRAHDKAKGVKRQKAKVQRQKEKAHPLRIHICHLPLAFCLLLTACSDNTKPTTRPMTVQERQDAALRDPFHYSPYSDKNDITGGDIDELDKEGLKRDLDHVFNP
jgi:hypothetical protein